MRDTTADAFKTPDKKNWSGLLAENPTEQVDNQEINFSAVSWFLASITKLTAILNSRWPETQSMN